MKPLSNLRAPPRRLPRGSASSSSSTTSTSSSASCSASSSSPNPRPRSNSGSGSSSRSLYTVANTPNSTLAFFDSPPPPNVQRPPRLPIKESSNQSAHNGSTSTNGNNTSHPSFQLGLSGTTLHPNDPLIQNNVNSSLFGYQQGNNGIHSNNANTTIPFYSYTPPANEQRRVQESPLGLRLDVGAYGIPKNGRRESFYDAVDHADLSVQVGEDSYFLRENSLGIADGVGGWAKKDRSYSSRGPTPSALFARRLMHFCSAELASSPLPKAPHLTTAVKPVSPTIHPPRFLPLFPHTSLAFPMHVRPVTPPPPPPINLNIIPSINFDSFQEDDYSELDALEDSLEELSEGIDVLQILERAWEATRGAHVNAKPSSTCNSKEPMLTGSSTALVAVLGAAEETPSTTVELQLEGGEVRLDVASAGKAITPISTKPLTHPTTDVPETVPSIPIASSPAKTPPPAVLRIAHIGDSMGMLVRGESIVWRSEELWYRFNTPHQLSPTSPPPSAPGLARIYTVPVQADDILILASDGLSDNLWDEEVLEVILRGRECAGITQPSSSQSPERMDPLGVLKRSTLAGILSESLCSRARRASEFGPKNKAGAHAEVPFAIRAKEAGKVFRGAGKVDDISVIVAVISPTSTGSVTAG